MARETKAQRELREALEEQARREQESRDYFPELMVALERAARNNFELDVCNMTFVLTDRDDRDNTFVFPAAYSADFDSYTFESLAFVCADKEAAEREYQRKQALRRSAVAKLTQEEREELGL